MFIDLTRLNEEMEARVRGLGSISVTELAMQGIQINRYELEDVVLRFASGDYGDVSPQRSWANDVALYRKVGTVWGLYTLPAGEKLVVLTQFNQPVTSISGAEDVGVKEYPGEPASVPMVDIGDDEDVQRTMDIMQDETVVVHDETKGGIIKETSDV